MSCFDRDVLFGGVREQLNLPALTTLLRTRETCAMSKLLCLGREGLLLNEILFFVLRTMP